MRRIFIIIIGILIIGGIYYLQPYFLALLTPYSKNPPLSTINYKLSTGTTVYRIGILPKDFPKEFIPVSALPSVSARRIVHPGGAVQISAQYEMTWTVDALRVFYTQGMDVGGWKHEEQLREGSAVIRATRGINESLHVVIAVIEEDKTRVSVVYSK